MIRYQLIGYPISIKDILLEKLDNRLGVKLSIGFGFDPFSEIVDCYQNIAVSIRCFGCDFVDDVYSPSRKRLWGRHII